MLCPDCEPLHGVLDATITPLCTQDGDTLANMAKKYGLMVTDLKASRQAVRGSAFALCCHTQPARVLCDRTKRP